jgi:hypothetical protein
MENEPNFREGAFLERRGVDHGEHRSEGPES